MPPNIDQAFATLELPTVSSPHPCPLFRLFRELMRSCSCLRPHRPHRRPRSKPNTRYGTSTSQSSRAKLAANFSGSLQQLALQQHPDKNPNDPHSTTRFQALGAAYNDLNRHFERRSSPGGGSSPFSGGGFGFSPFGFGPFGGGPFGFGGGGGAHGPDCTCGMDRSDDGYYDDGDDDYFDDDDAFFQSVMNFRRLKLQLYSLQPCTGSYLRRC